MWIIYTQCTHAYLYDNIAAVKDFVQFTPDTFTLPFFKQIITLLNSKIMLYLCVCVHA
jgi:hypothetical protein